MRKDPFLCPPPPPHGTFGGTPYPRPFGTTAHPQSFLRPPPPPVSGGGPSPPPAVPAPLGLWGCPGIEGRQAPAPPHTAALAGHQSATATRSPLLRASSAEWQPQRPYPRAPRAMGTHVPTKASVCPPTAQQPQPRGHFPWPVQWIGDPSIYMCPRGGPPMDHRRS